MSVYGDMLLAFPELMRPVVVWTNPDQSDKRTIQGVFIPTQGDQLKRWKFSNRGSALDYSDKDQLFIHVSFKDRVTVGDYFRDLDDNDIRRIVGRQDFNHPGGFMVFTTERLTGATCDQTEQLEVKGASFA